MIAKVLERLGVELRVAPVRGPHARRGFPNVRLTTHRKLGVRFYDDLLKDKVVVISFMYTRCNGTCPPTIASLRRLQTVLGDRAGRDVFLYSITLDPTHDTVQVLDEYATTVAAGPAWHFLTGRPDDITAVRQRLGFVNRDPIIDADKSQHSGLLLFGNVPADRWVACPALFGTERLMKLLSRVSSGVV
jgi:protein SCO1/2